MDEEKKEDGRIEQEESSVKQSLKQGMYYIIIAVISFISVVFLPMLGSTLGLGWKLPDTTAGWVVWGASRAIVATINVLLFHSFMEQAKLNIKDNEHYKEARDILVKVKKKEHKPKSPAQWNAAQYGKKGVSLFLASAMSVVAIGQAVLSYEWPTALAYLFTLGMGIIFGIMQMKKAETYWTTEYYEYALMKKRMEEEQQIAEQSEQTQKTEENAVTTTEEQIPVCVIERINKEEQEECSQSETKNLET